MVVFLIIGCILTTLLLVRAFWPGEDEIDILLSLPDLEPDSEIEQRLLQRFANRASDAADLHRLGEYIYVQAENGNAGGFWCWHHLLWLGRKYLSPEEYFYAAETAKACLLLSEDEILFPEAQFKRR